MTTHLLQIVLGPVQEFIAQARRTRDLWYGSHLLSEVSRAAARSLAQTPGVSLIFPALDVNIPEDKAELAPCPAPFRNTGGEKTPPLAVANIILAEITGADDAAVRALAESARSDVQLYWKEGLAGRVRESCANLLASGIGPVWNEQIDTFLEFAAAWTEVNEQTEGYKGARDRLAEAIAARKNLRDFEPWQHDRVGAPKSSLDGARVSVLKEKEERPPGLVRKYRLGENEQLDAVGLVKRAGGETDESGQSNDLQFVPIVNVALASWMQKAEQTHGVQFRAVEAALRKDFPGWPRVTRGIACGRGLFGFDASVFLRSRWWPECKELRIWEPSALHNEKNETKRQVLEAQWRKDVENWCLSVVGPKRAGSAPPLILDLMSEPYPYVACLAADGDGMGSAIDGLKTAEEHRKFSRELARFAQEARKIVESEKCLGSLVYSGGDDVLAFLPVATALRCADALRKAFEEIMANALPAAAQKPTLSVGIGVGHVMESMSDLLDLGRRAEKLAKGGHLKNELRRNALSVIVDKRSGGTREWRRQWLKNSGQENPVQRLLADQKLLDDRLSSRKVYQIADIVRRLPAPAGGAGDASDGFARVLLAEVGRTLARTDSGAGGLALTDVGLDELETASDYAAKRSRVLDWVNRMLIARTFAESGPKVRAGRTDVEAAA